MWTVLAYILLLIVPTFSTIATIVFAPVSFLLTKVEKLGYLGALLSAAVQSVIAIVLAYLIFSFADVKFTWLPIVILAIMFFRNDYQRLNSGRRIEPQLGYLIGDIVGILVAGTFLLSLQKFSIYLAGGGVIIAIVAYSKYVKNGNIYFWQLIQLHPQEAFRLLQSDESWLVVAPGSYSDTAKYDPRNDASLAGPFKFQLSGRIYELFCLKKNLQESQGRIVDALSSQ